MLMISREDAKALGKTRYFTGIPCSKGHISERTVDTYGCVACIQDRAAKKRLESGSVPRPKNESERVARRQAALKKYAENHKDSLKESQKKYKEAHPERRKQTQKKWDEANKEKRHQSYVKRYYGDIESSRKRHAIHAQNRRGKIKEVGGVLSKNIFDKLFALQRGRCACCKIDLTTVVAHIDHIFPIALGGENSNRNVQLLCKPCNHQKSWRHPVDFMQSRGFLL